ncbi:MAG: TldD/PmbA family protein [Planctomycetota bacterium]|nr:MAG: TldD/PmbA family protein [Planctomycetota bacterium]
MKAKAMQAICKKMLKWTSAPTAEVRIHSFRQGLTRFADNSITQNVQELTDGVTFTARFGNRIGSASSTSVDDASLKRVVSEAERVARAVNPDKDLLPFLGMKKYKKMLGFVRKTADTGPDFRARQVGKVIKAAKAKRLTTAGIYSNSVARIAIANTAGLFVTHANSNASTSITMMTKDSAGWASDGHRDIDKIPIKNVIDTAIDKALKSHKPKAIKPGKYTVILEPDAVSNLLLFLAWGGLNGLALYEKRSCFSGMQNKLVVNPKITLTDDAYHPLQNGMPFDWEGMPRQAVTLIEKGRFIDGVYDRGTAKKAKKKPTGHGQPQPNTWGAFPGNMVVEPGDATLDEMIASLDRGILVTQFHYTNIINPKKLDITGMTRSGTFWVEKGKIKYPIKNMRFTQGVPLALRNVRMVGKDLKNASSLFGGGFVVPPLMIKDFTFSSGTDF